MTVAAAMPSVQVGDPLRARGIAVAPVFPRDAPRARHVTLDEALPPGLRIEAVDASGSVPELRAVNPTRERVLLYDAQELLGAKQNRILDASVLVEARATLTIPVSCVEQGRWSARSATFAAAEHASHPELRRRKAQRLASAPPGRGDAQAEVWAEVAAKSERLGVRSATGAQSDMYDQRGPEIGELARRFPLQPGRCGSVLALAGRPVCLDLLSRPDAFARLYPKLLSGYLMDAIEHLGAPDVPQEEIDRFARTALRSPVRAAPGAGLGEALRVAGDGVLGSGLALDGEILQLSVHAGAGTL